MRVLMLLLFTPALSWGALIEWTGTGPQTYFWEDQANPTASISILADETRIHRIEVTNTKTTFAFDDPVVNFLYSESLGRWGGNLTVRGFEPEQYPGDPGTTLNTLIGWHIYGPETLNPFTDLGNLYYVGVGNDQFREFNFVPDTWTKQCVSGCENGEPADVPTPASLGLAVLGLLGVGLRRFLTVLN